MKKIVVMCWLMFTLCTTLPSQTIAAKTSLPDIEDEVMCPSCQVPLNTAQSPQAERQRAFIRDLIRQGKNKTEIKSALVDEYGSSVLAVPEKGSKASTLAYLVPLILGILITVGVGVLFWRWRQNTKEFTTSA